MKFLRQTLFEKVTNLFELQINFSYRNLPIFKSNWHNNISRGYFTSTTPENVYTVNLLREMFLKIDFEGDPRAWAQLDIYRVVSKYILV